MAAMASDEVLKHALASHAFEQFEAGCYCSLTAAAEEAGEPEIARSCERIMRAGHGALGLGASAADDAHLRRARRRRRRRQTLSLAFGLSVQPAQRVMAAGVVRPAARTRAGT